MMSAPPWPDAACLDVDVNTFFAATASARRRALAVCRGCPIRIDCLDWAVATDERFGIWGGKTERQRRAIAAAATRAADG